MIVWRSSAQAQDLPRLTEDKIRTFLHINREMEAEFFRHERSWADYLEYLEKHWDSQALLRRTVSVYRDDVFIEQKDKNISDFQLKREMEINHRYIRDYTVTHFSIDSIKIAEDGQSAQASTSIERFYIMRPLPMSFKHHTMAYREQLACEGRYSLAENRVIWESGECTGIVNVAPVSR